MEIRRFEQARDEPRGSPYEIGHQHAPQAGEQSRSDEEHDHQEDGQARRRGTQQIRRCFFGCLLTNGRCLAMREPVRGVQGLRSEGCRRLAGGVMARDHDKVVHPHQSDGQEGDDHQPRD